MSMLSSNGQVYAGAPAGAITFVGAPAGAITFVANWAVELRMAVIHAPYSRLPALLQGDIA
jgi:hypothetical protein